MIIESIEFKRTKILRRRSVSVTIKNGYTYSLNVSRGRVYVDPRPDDDEVEALHDVYQATWKYLAYAKPGTPLDADAKRACARLVKRLDWTSRGIEDTEAKLHFLVNSISAFRSI